MELLNLGHRSRNTGIVPKIKLPKDKYGMEDLNDYFDDSSETTSENIKSQAASLTGEVEDEENSKSAFHSFASTSPSLDFADLLSVNQNFISHGTVESPMVIHQIPSWGSDSNYDNSVPYENESEGETRIDSEVSSTCSPYNKSTYISKPNITEAIYSETENVSSSDEVEIHPKAHQPTIATISDFDGLDSTEDDMSHVKFKSTDTPHTERKIISPKKKILLSSPAKKVRTSKRNRITPLAYWRNERAEYTKSSSTISVSDRKLAQGIQRLPLLEISKVVRFDEKQPLESKLKKRKQSRKANVAQIEKCVDENDLESYLKIKGCAWLKNQYLELDAREENENFLKRKIAWAPNGGDFKQVTSQEANGLSMGNYNVASLFGSEANSCQTSLLNFPLDGHKSHTYGGKSLIIFYVAHGLMEVTYNSDKFVVTKGCSFTVHPFNSYSLKNIGEENVKLFCFEKQIS